jgi:hypothetical protein
MQHPYWIRKFRLLTAGLIFSAILNVGLVGALVAFFWSEQSLPLPQPPSFAVDSVKEDEVHRTWVARLPHASYRELLSDLINQEPLEQGYRKRDFALGALVAFHDFDIDRALGGVQMQKRVCILGNDTSLELYPGLTEDQFLAIVRFAYSEQWPMTPRGLFSRLKRQKEPSLMQAFAVTTPYRIYQSLFPQTTMHDLIALLCEGEWSQIENVWVEQEKKMDASDDRKRAILQSYLSQNSSLAAELFLHIDMASALKKLDDQSILQVLHAHQGKSDALHTFCLALLQSPRSDAVRKKSAELLYRMAGESMPEPYRYEEVVRRFIPAPPEPTSMPVQNGSDQVQKPPAPVQQEKKPSPPVQIKSIAVPQKAIPQSMPGQVPAHVVQEGETLWKIARIYRVRIEDLIEMNHLEKETIHPGMVLKVPDHDPLDERDGNGRSCVQSISSP